MGRMLYADVVRSPYAHAKVLSVDPVGGEEAPRREGSVIDGTDYQKRVGLYLEDRFFMIKPGDTAKYMGDPDRGPSRPKRRRSPARRAS